MITELILLRCFMHGRGGGGLPHSHLGPLHEQWRDRQLTLKLGVP